MARYNNILETIGKTPLVKLNALAPDGVNVYVKMESFNPMGHIPTGVKLTSYAGESGDISEQELQGYVDQICEGDLKLQTGPVFPFEKLHQAHQLMDDNRANGKIVILTG